MILQAEAVLEGQDRLHAGGGLLVEAGRIAAVLGSPQAVRRAARRTGSRVQDVGEGVLLPGWVNAHAHLELSGYRGRLPRSRDFVRWIESILALRRTTSPAELVAGVHEGVRELVASGTTTVGDIASAPESWRASRWPMRSVVYREVLDAGDEARASWSLGRVHRPLAARARSREGLSPHAPYTTSAALLAGAARLVHGRRLPVTVHWAESEAERPWLTDGTGSFARLLSGAPQRSGLGLLEDAGLLRRGTSLVHGNHPARGEAARIARASVPLVHCPGTHAFFRRGPFPWATYARAGVEIALGTDSLASNEALDMRREVRLARSSAPELSPREVFAMATVGGARAMGLEREVGSLRKGLAADVVHARVEARSVDGVIDAWTAAPEAMRAVQTVWIGGRRAFRADG